MAKNDCIDVDEYEVFSRRWQYPPEIDKILKANVDIGRLDQ